MAITHPSSISPLHYGESVTVPANTDGGVHYATDVSADSDTRIRATFQKRNNSGTALGDFSLGVGYKINGHTLTNTSVKWSVTFFLYLSKDSDFTNVERPAFYINSITSGGITISESDWAQGNYFVSDLPKFAGGDKIGVNGCIAKITSEYTSSSDSVTATRQFNVKFQLKNGGTYSINSCSVKLTWANKKKFTKTFKSMKDGLALPNIKLNWGDSFGSSVNITKWQGESSTTPTLNNTSTSINTTKDVNIRFYNEGTLVDTKTGTVKATQNYNASWNWAGTSIALGGSMQFNSGGTYWPDWGPSGTAEPTTAFKPILPTTERTGYKFKEWVAEDGESCGVTGTSKKGFQYDARVNATWTPLEYKFRYILSREATSSLKPKSIDPFTKTYGTPIKLSDIIPEWTDKRLLFAGWKGSKTGKIYQPGQTIDDAEFTNKSTIVDLEAQWNPNPNTINLIYYYDGGFKNPDRRTYNYNDISSGQIWRINAPVWIDHSFIGWSVEKPADFDSNKGVYMSEEDIPATIKHNIINNLVISKDKPSMYIPWSRTDTYYGIWIKTGKKMKLSPSSAEEPRWIDIQTVYFNSPSGWKKVTDIWVKTPNGWKHEI